MLKDNNNDQIIARGIHKQTIFFCQIWQELLDNRTLDIYQYRVLTSLSALEELAEVLEKTLSGLFNNDANIECCREELLYILNTDPLMEKYYKASANQIKNTLGHKPKSDADKNQLLYRTNYCVREMALTYMTHALDELKQNILSESKEQIELYANMVASQAVHNGWSARALSDLLRFFGDGRTFEEEWMDFSNMLLNGGKQEFEVLINVPFKRSENVDPLNRLQVLQSMGLGVFTYEELVEKYSDIKDISSLLKAEKKYFVIPVMAHDIYTASHTAIRTISDRLNMASFFNLTSVWDLAAVTIVPINFRTRYHKQIKAEQLYKTYDYLDSSGKVFDYTKEILADSNKKELREKLKGVFSYTNISRGSLFQEEKYMNLWIALESLARTNMYSDIISNVKETVPAAVSIRYIYRLVRNYVEDCIRCGIEFDFDDSPIDMKQDTKQLLVKETIKIFQNSETYAVLLQKSSVNDLLQYRTKMVHDILVDADSAFKKIVNNNNRVKWQIQRLYRIRNEIIHTALQNNTSLITYIEHLYDYLSIYLSEIVTYAVTYGSGDIEETLCAIKDNYEVFVAFMQNKDLTFVEKVMETGVIHLI